MSHRNKKRVDTSDSEPDEAMLEVIEQKHLEEDDAHNGSEEHGQLFDIKTKLALVNRVREINKRRSISHKVAVKHLDYSQLDIEGLGPEEAKECLNQILEPINAMRTLDEMLNDYLENYQKYELKKALHAPKLPANPVMRYIQQNRAELERKLIKKNPNEKIKLGDVSRYGAKRYHKLPEEERQRYKDLYKQELDEYHKQRDELIRMNPELKKPRKKYDQTLSKKTPRGVKEGSKPEKEETVVTPFKLFHKELKEKNPDIKFRDAQIQYQNLGDADKLGYINKVLYLDTDLDKIFTSDEKKIMKHSSGMPIRPLSAYNAFVQGKIKNMELGKGKSSMKIISDMWKNVSPEEKKFYDKKFNEDLEIWKQQMMAWINTLPMDQRAEQIAKHKLFVKQNKRKRDDSVSGGEEMVVKIEEENIRNIIEIAGIESRQKSPKKKKQTSESESVSSPSPSKKNQTAVDWDQVFETNKTSSPKKASIEKQLAAFGEYPSQSTAHYFMVKHGGGKSGKKLAKAYKELTKAEKKKLFLEMSQAKTSYLNKIKDFAKKVDPKHSSKVLEFHKQNMEQQTKSIAWHVASGTDNESDSSDSDDDDDDDDDSDDS